MPDAEPWNRFFDAKCVIRKLFEEEGCRGSVVEFGCGYGTFTFPGAKLVAGDRYILGLTRYIHKEARRCGQILPIDYDSLMSDPMQPAHRINWLALMH